MMLCSRSNATGKLGEDVALVAFCGSVEFPYDLATGMSNERLAKLQEFAAKGAVGALSPGQPRVVTPEDHHNSSPKVNNDQYERILLELQEELVKMQVCLVFFRLVAEL